MDRYISREAVFQVVHGIARGIATKDTEAFMAKDMKAFYKAKGAKEILDSVDTNLCYIPATDVQPVDRWISVKNKFPNDGERVIACTVDKMVLEMKFDKRRECWGRLDIDGMHLFGKSFVTRWMPLPEPPKDGDTND